MSPDPLPNPKISAKNKTLAVWLAFLWGWLGTHRFYLYGFKDGIGYLHLLASVAGWYGIARARALGLDDTLSWFLIPFLGFNWMVCALYAIVYGLMPADKWGNRFNPHLTAQSNANQTSALTIWGVALALAVGAGAFIASLAYSFEHFYQYQIEQARLISQ